MRFEAKVFLALDFADPASPRALCSLGFGAVPVRTWPGDFDSRCHPFRFPRGGAFPAAEVIAAGATHLTLVRRSIVYLTDLAAWSANASPRWTMPALIPPAPASAAGQPVP